MLTDHLKPLKKILRPFVPEFVLRGRKRMAVGQMARKKGLSVVAHDLFYDLVRGNTVLRLRKSHVFYLSHMIENFDYYGKFFYCETCAKSVLKTNADEAAAALLRWIDAERYSVHR